MDQRPSFFLDDGADDDYLDRLDDWLRLRRALPEPEPIDPIDHDESERAWAEYQQYEMLRDCLRLSSRTRRVFTTGTAEGQMSPVRSALPHHGPQEGPAADAGGADLRPRTPLRTVPGDRPGLHVHGDRDEAALRPEVVAWREIHGMQRGLPVLR